MAGIGTLNESPLHAGLKDYLARPGDEFEVPLAGFVIDIRRGNELLEIQMKNFGSLASKFDRLLDQHRLTLVHPIAVQTYIRRSSRPDRRSPRKGTVLHVFEELVSIPTLIEHPRFGLRVILIEEIQVREHAPELRRRRGGWRIVERSLREVLDDIAITTTSDLAQLLPAGLPETFTTQDLAEAASIPRQLSQKMAYCLRHLSVIEPGGRKRAGIQYQRVG